MVVYHTTKKIQIKLYTICSSHQLGLEVERPEWSTTLILLFSLFYTIKEIFSVFRRFFTASKFRAGSVYEVSYHCFEYPQHMF